MEIASAVALQVQNQMFHTLFAELVERLVKFFVRRGGETIQADVSGRCIGHISSV